MENLKDELGDMTTFLSEDLKQETTDAEIEKLMEKLTDLEKQIVDIIK